VADSDNVHDLYDDEPIRVKNPKNITTRIRVRLFSLALFPAEFGPNMCILSGGLFFTCPDKANDKKEKQE
jgi:hypothetical protein